MRVSVDLRPKTLDEYVGQASLKKNLRIFLEAAKKRGEAAEHTLLCGPPGLGKTSLAYIIANELGVGIKVTSGPAIEKVGEMAAILTNLKKGDILFIDEIHRLGKVIEEILYPAMEEFKLDVIVGQGPGARSLRINLEHFTLIGATTREGLLSAPLRDRFGIIFKLNYYTKEEIKEIILRSASILEVKIEEEGIEEIAKRSRGVPRIANRLLKRVRDFAQVLSHGVITKEIAKEALSSMKIDESGLDETDIKILRTIVEKFSGGPVGINTLALSLSEEPRTIEDVYEPYLIKMGYIKRTPKGRVATLKAYRYLGFNQK